MSISQPSRVVYSIDVPEVNGFSAAFRYNFFVPDEAKNDTGGVSTSVLMRPAAQLGASFMQYSVTRVPRLVEFNWTILKIIGSGGVLSELEQRNNAFRTSPQYGSLISDNMDKVVTEDYFSSFNFVGISFHDGEIDSKAVELIQGTKALQTLGDDNRSYANDHGSAMQLASNLPNQVKAQFVSKAMTNPRLTYGATFSQLPMEGTSQDFPVKHTNALPTVDTYYSDLARASINVQVSSRLLHDLVNKSIKDPSSVTSSDLSGLHGYSKALKQSANQQTNFNVSEQDYKTFVPYVDVKKQSTATHAQKYRAELVGYIIDKVEVLPDGTLNPYPPIVIEDPNVGKSADVRVKFKSRYIYTIRSIVMLTMSAISDDNGDVATIRVLVSSKPSNPINIETVDYEAPPPPADVGFVWDYRNDKLMLKWAFPVTSQRDIKQFQVFKRKSIYDSFELQQVYDFDDSAIKFDEFIREIPSHELVQKLTSPCTYYIDDEFDWNVNTNEQRSVIYAVCAIDAHGLTSNYSAQFRVWFDRFKNKLVSKLVSHTGAPKTYPNMYVEGEAFTNTIKLEANSFRKIKLYFTPSCYYTFDNNNAYTPLYATKQVGGSYKLQFLNLDNFRDQSIDIDIDNPTGLDPTFNTQLEQAFSNVDVSSLKLVL